MTTQVRNAAMVNLLRADLQARYEPQKALYSVMATVLALPGLRGFWPMSAVDASGNAFDQSGNARTLTYNGNPTYNYDSLAPYIDLDGTGDYLSRADEAGLDILGTETYVANPGLTLGGWFWLNALPGAFQAFITKTNLGAQRSYELNVDTASSVGVFRVINTGTGGGVAVTSAALSATTWFFVAGRFTPSTEIAIWINDTKSTNTTSIVASAFNSTSALAIGGISGGASGLLAGRASLCFLCASALSDAIIGNLFQQSRALFGV